MIKPLNVFITGVSGSLGRAVTKELLSRGNVKIKGYSRCEHRQKLMESNPNLQLYLGDVRDRERLLEASRGSDIIFHFAALKHVDTLELNPEESIRTNIEGTANVLHAQRMNKIKRVVLSSTDKAVEPINVYGASKMIAEKLTLRNQNNIVTRYGNVVASTGSVIPLFVKSLREKKVVYITDLKMTRFLIRLEDAAKYVVEQGLDSKGGLKIPPMKACRIEDLADAVASIMGIKSYGLHDIGMRPGEKLSEWLVSAHDGKAITSDNVPHFTKQELVELIKPSVKALL